MQNLDLRANMGPGASIGDIETMVRGLRVALDIGYAAAANRVRWDAEDQMKYPTDDELSAFVDQAASSSRLVGERAAAQLSARGVLRNFDGVVRYEAPFRRRYPYGAFSYAEVLSLLSDVDRSLLDTAGYLRYLRAPLANGIPGLDVVDPELYDALVGSEVERRAPGQVRVAGIGYENPFWAKLVALLTGKPVLDSAVRAVEIGRDWSADRAKGKADAEAAHEDARAKRIANDKVEAEFLDSRRYVVLKEKLMLRAIQAGRRDLAEAFAAVPTGDIPALMLVASRPSLELETYETDDDEDAG